MTTAPPRPSVTACRQCAGRPAAVLETVSASRHDNTRIADHLAAELGNGAHTHAAPDGDMYVVRPIGTAS
ncbi:hypothetical protein [Streptomyces sp. V1I6]|uniref:hypothetical protein n=1 Tax=Streptomyces sp. V1I6 TaxID=3042273 RepID=UPI002780DE65|nr:hypothetical protein [Streptomyces sp. V1I6]MDQ0847731.1 hypothetical protein [Streptomyces sp. V1I6]